MLWFVGVTALIIDIFFRISIPIDQLYRHRNSKNSSHDLSLNATEFPLSDTAPLPNAIIIDEKGISLLLDRLGVASGDRKGLIQTLQNVPVSKANDKDSQQEEESEDATEKQLNDDQTDNKDNTPESKQKTRDNPASPAENTDDGKKDVASSPAAEKSNNGTDSPS